MTNRVITGLQGLADTITTRYQYDVMNRLTNVVQLTNGTTSASAWYRYDAAGRLWQKGYGNNDVVTHGYDAESRLLSLGITNNTTPVWWSTYLWDNGGNILAITNNNTNVTLYAYDRARQLTNEVCLTNGIAGGTTNSWSYDEAGNWLNAPGGSRWLYNADNEMVARAPSGTPTVPSPTSFTLTEMNPTRQPMQRPCQGILRWRGFSVYEPSQARKAQPTSHSTTQRHARLGALSQSTQRRGFAGLLHPSTSSSLLIRVATAPAMSPSVFAASVTMQADIPRQVPIERRC